MKVRMKKQVSGYRNGQPWPEVGETMELPDNEGADLCAGGLAVPVAETREQSNVVETREDKDTPEVSEKPVTTEKRKPGRPAKATTKEV